MLKHSQPRHVPENDSARTRAIMMAVVSRVYRRGRVMACPARDAAMSARQRPARGSVYSPGVGPRAVRPRATAARAGTWPEGYWQVSAKMYLRYTRSEVPR